MKRSLASTAAVVALPLALAATPASPQVAPVTVSVSDDAIEMGTVFDLQVGIPVPPGRVVYFPDTLPATVYVESAGPTVAAAEPAPDGGARLTLTYPVMAFGVGQLPVPGFDILVAERRDDADGTVEIPGGSRIGRWSEAPREAGATTVTRVPRQEIWVEPVFTPADFMEGIEPMPPNDVAGGSWSWPSLFLAMACSSLLVVTLVSATRARLEGGERTGSESALSLAARRERALEALDDLLAEGLHAEGRMLDFYTRASGIVRGYVEAMDPSWASSLTGTELMDRLHRRAGATGAGDLPHRMVAAEVVKFGRLRPDSAAAEADWRAIRGWIADSEELAW